MATGIDEFVEISNSEDMQSMFFKANQDYRLIAVIQQAITFAMSFESEEDLIKQKISQGNVALGITLRDWNNEASKFSGEGVNALSWYFLRDLLGGLHMTRHRHPFVFQKSLFEAPNEEKTEVYNSKKNSREFGECWI